jgi:hypothetical protein
MTTVAENDRPSRRAVTDSIVQTVGYAKADPGTWIKFARSFKTRENAGSTASCVRRGFLRVRPQQGEKKVEVGEHTYLALPGRCEVRIEHDGERWWLWLRARRLFVTRKSRAA